MSEFCLKYKRADKSWHVVGHIKQYSYSSCANLVEYNKDAQDPQKLWSLVNLEYGLNPHKRGGNITSDEFNNAIIFKADLVTGEKLSLVLVDEAYVLNNDGKTFEVIKKNSQR